MLLRIVENGNHFRDIVIQEGETFLLPGAIYSPLNSNLWLYCSTHFLTSAGNTPHCPVRYKDTIGLVMERTRPSGSIDHIRWYCPNKEAHQNVPTIIREETFHCEDIESQLKEVIEDWMGNESSRKCGSCGAISPAQ